MKHPDIANTDFENTELIHDWRNYVGENVRSIWNELPANVRMAIALDADNLASREDWE